MCLFNTEERAQAYYDSLVSRPVQFLPRQVQILRVKLTIQGEVAPKSG